MKPAHLDLEVFKGSTFLKQIQWKTGTPAVPVNLTGYKARMQIRKSVNDTTILDSLTTENSRLSIYAPTEGRVSISIAADISSAYTFTSGVYDLELVAPDNVTVYRILEGCFSANPEVTR